MWSFKNLMITAEKTGGGYQEKEFINKHNFE